MEPDEGLLRAWSLQKARHPVFFNVTRDTTVPMPAYLICVCMLVCVCLNNNSRVKPCCIAQADLKHTCLSL